MRKPYTKKITILSKKKICKRNDDIDELNVHSYILYFTLYYLTLTINAGFTYRLDRLKPRTSKLWDLRPRCIIFLTLLFDFHTYAVIAHCTF